MLWVGFPQEADAEMEVSRGDVHWGLFSGSTSVEDVKRAGLDKERNWAAILSSIMLS